MTTIETDATPETDAAPKRPLHYGLGVGGLGIGLLLGVAIGAFVLPTFAIGIRTTGATHIERAAEFCDVGIRAWESMGASGDSITWGNTDPRLAERNSRNIHCLLGELDAPPSVIDHIGNAHASGGRHVAEWRGFAASWNYHAVNGLGATIEAVRDDG